MSLIKDYRKNLHKMHFRFSHLFQLEILQGCSWNCTGCYVDRSNMGWKPGDDLRFLKLCEEWLAQGDYLKDIVIGPTDFMTAKNTKEILSTPTMQKIIGLFDNITFNSAFLGKNSGEWGEAMSLLIPQDKLIQIDVVLNYQLLETRRYTDMIRSHIDAFEKSYRGDFHVTFVLPTVVETEEDKKIFLPRDLLRVEKLIAENFYGIYGVHSGNSFLRTADLEKDRDRLVSHVRWLRDMYDGICEQDPQAEMDFVVARRGSPFHQYHAYFNGSWYHCPYLYDEVAIWDPAFLVPTPEWKVEEFNNYYDQLMQKQLTNLKGKPCDGCEYLDYCNPLFTPDFIDRLGLKECIIPKKAVAHYGADSWLFRDRIVEAAGAAGETKI